MIRDLRPLALVLAAMVVADALWNPTILAWLYLFPESFAATVTPIADAVDSASFLFKIATMIVFAVWIYRAGSNLAASGVEGLEFSPASRVWWFFVPILCLFKPFQGMRELWNASRGAWPYDQNDGLISTWWAIWLGQAVIVRVASAAASDGMATLWVTTGFGIAAAATALPIIRGVTRAQSGLHHAALEEVFA